MLTKRTCAAVTRSVCRAVMNSVREATSSMRLFFSRLNSICFVISLKLKLFCTSSRDSVVKESNITFEWLIGSHWEWWPTDCEMMYQTCAKKSHFPFVVDGLKWKIPLYTFTSGMGMSTSIFFRTILRSHFLKAATAEAVLRSKFSLPPPNLNNRD